MLVVFTLGSFQGQRNGILHSTAQDWSAASFANCSAVINGGEGGIDWKTEQMTEEKPNTPLDFTHIELQFSKA